MRTQRQSATTDPVSGRSGMLLVVLAGLALLMPMDYRAGTDQAHTHSVFQIWIDAAIGRSHHHPETEPHAHAAEQATADTHAAGHVLAEAGTWASTLSDAVHSAVMWTTDAAMLPDVEPDVAEPVSSRLVIQHADVLGLLGLLVAALLIPSVRRTVGLVARPLPCAIAPPDPPPPRRAI